MNTLAEIGGTRNAWTMVRIASLASAQIGRNIKKVREARGWTQDRLGAESGIDSSNIRSYENGRAMPGIPSVVRMACALGIPPGDLLEGVTVDQLAPSTRERSSRY